MRKESPQEMMDDEAIDHEMENEKPIKNGDRVALFGLEEKGIDDGTLATVTDVIDVDGEISIIAETDDDQILRDLGPQNYRKEEDENEEFNRAA